MFKLLECPFRDLITDENFLKEGCCMLVISLLVTVTCEMDPFLFWDVQRRLKTHFLACLSVCSFVS